MKKSRTPDGLLDTGLSFWTKVLNEFELDSEHDLARLLMAAKCLDEIHSAERQVRLDGRFMKNRYGNTVEHVACKTIRDTRLLFVKIIRELALDIAPPDSRPPRQY